jgi:hypothetical protein
MLRFAVREPGRRKPKKSFELNGVEEESSKSEEHQEGVSDSVSSGGLSQLFPNRTTVFTCLVVTIGTIASMLFLGFGISGAVRVQQIQFDLRAGELMTEIQAAFADYETASLWLHESCRSRQITRPEFRNVYEYMVVGDGDMFHHGLEVEVRVGQELDHFLKVPGAHRFVFLIRCL